MGVEFLVRDKLTDELVAWNFKVNKYGFVDVYIEGKFTDSLLELGFTDSYSELERKIEEQLMAWGVDWHSYAHSN